MKPISLWYKWIVDKQGERWEFNHLSEGLETGHPVSKHPSHDHAWKNGKWKVEFAKLEHGVVIKGTL